jgi:hypothetical protein
MVEDLTPPPDDAPRVSSQRERDLMLEEVMRNAEEKEILRVVSKRPGIPVRQLVVAVLLGILGVGSWFIPLPFLDAPPPPRFAPESQEAALRFAVTLQRDRVLDHRVEAHRLPEFIREVGDTLPGVSYERLSGGRFRIDGVTEEASVSYTFPDSLTVFLQDALVQIARGRQ